VKLMARPVLGSIAYVYECDMMRMTTLTIKTERDNAPAKIVLILDIEVKHVKGLNERKKDAVESGTCHPLDDYLLRRRRRRDTNRRVKTDQLLNMNTSQSH